MNCPFCGSESTIVITFIYGKYRVCNNMNCRAKNKTMHDAYLISYIGDKAYIYGIEQEEKNGWIRSVKKIKNQVVIE